MENSLVSFILILFADVLLYVSEAFMPFLQIFYSELYRKDSLEQSKVEGESTDLLYQALLVSDVPLYIQNWCLWSFMSMYSLLLWNNNYE